MIWIFTASLNCFKMKQLFQKKSLHIAGIRSTCFQKNTQGRMYFTP